MPIAPGALAARDRFAMIGDRVIAEFRKTPHNELYGLDDLWGRGLLRHHVPLASLISQGDGYAVAEHISELHRNSLGMGLKWPATWDELVTNAGMAPHLRHVMIDRIASLAEYLGLVPVYNPEGYPAPAGYGAEQIARLLGEIDNRLGYEIAAPPCYSLAFGVVRPSGATLDDRAINAVYTADRIVDLLKGMGVAAADAHILEIGGGIGNLANQCLKRGIGRYSMVDIPTVRAIQVYFALSTVPEADINFSAEGMRSAARLDVLRPPDLGAFADRSVHVVVNENSLPEIEREAAIAYLRQIARIARGCFLSINHESGDTIAGHQHGRVFELVGGANIDRFRRLQRSRHWLWPGYIEEIYASATAR